MRNSFPFGIAVLSGSFEKEEHSKHSESLQSVESRAVERVIVPGLSILLALFIYDFYSFSPSDFLLFPFHRYAIRNFNINNNRIVVLLQSHWRLNDEQNFHATLEAVIVICTGNHFHSRRGEIVIEKNTALENFTFESVRRQRC